MNLQLCFQGLCCLYHSLTFWAIHWQFPSPGEQGFVNLASSFFSSSSRNLEFSYDEVHPININNWNNITNKNSFRIHLIKIKSSTYLHIQVHPYCSHRTQIHSSPQSTHDMEQPYLYSSVCLEIEKSSEYSKSAKLYSTKNGVSR